MKPINTLITILFISLLSSPSWSATIDDLVQREGIYYQKFTNVPFSGKITGRQQGSFKNGVKDGTWVWYYENGQVFFKGSYKNGKKEGAWVRYYDNGQLFYKGNFKNGKKEGAWVRNHSDGTLSKTLTGTFKDGVKISD